MGKSQFLRVRTLSGTDRDDKSVWVVIDGEKIKTGVKKFGALVGDGTRIGANAVTSPGTILKPATVVARLELVQQYSLECRLL